MSVSNISVDLKEDNIGHLRSVIIRVAHNEGMIASLTKLAKGKPKIVQNVAYVVALDRKLNEYKEYV